MRRGTKLALVAGGAMVAVAGGAIARSRLPGRGPAIPRPVTGTFANDRRFPQDVLEFVRQRPAPGLETGGERPTVRGELVGAAAG